MDQEILKAFLIETRELLEKAQEDTLRLEAEPGNDEILASIFRTFHTIKGTASFLEIHHLVEWAHNLENLLDKLRSHQLAITSPRVDAILKGLDVVEAMMQDLSQNRLPSPGPQELGQLIRTLSEEKDSIPEPDGEAAPETSPSTAPSSTGQSSRSSSSLPRHPEGMESSLRVDAQRLDAAMNQVGELVLLRNRLASAVSSLGKENEDMMRIAREMDLAVNDIQNSVMHLRMQPCKRLFQQLPRVVRDISRQLGKQVRLDVIGEEVEIDKTVVDALSGPLTHLVRNSLDHGIELPEARVAAGKPSTAVLRVAAIHLGDKVRIEVHDDGRGIDRRLVLQKAIDKGLVSAEQAAHLSEKDSLELIFRRGFSTKEEASGLSGRGVGMDVVKETTHQLRGRLSIDTTLGQGTRIAMEFPLTLAVLPVLYLRIRQDTYALPISSIDSLTDLEESRMHSLNGRATYRLDGTQTVPLVDLGDILQSKPLRMGSESVEGVLTERGLFIVSEVLGNEDSVVKPIDFLTMRNWYQGATISGRGSVVLILDATALSRGAMAAEAGRG